MGQEGELHNIIKGKFDRNKLIDKLSQHLNEIGISARVIDKNGPEAIHHDIPVLCEYNILKFPRIGVVKIEGKDIEFIEVVRSLPDSEVPGLLYSYIYMLRCELKVQNETILAQASVSNRMAENGNNIVVEFRGGQLAKELNDDHELLKNMNMTKLTTIKIIGIPMERYVAIMNSEPRTIHSFGPFASYGKFDYPSSLDFDVYEGIARHVRKFLKE